MNLVLTRFDFQAKCTIGKLDVGPLHCYTLEDVDRHLEDGGEKVYGQTAIPRGLYKVIVTFSNRFNRELPLLVDVPGYEGVRIHPGNTDADTEGCILVGRSYGNDFVGNSRGTFNALFDQLDAAYQRGEEITIEVK